jgi:hypothetical protein
MLRRLLIVYNWLIFGLLPFKGVSNNGRQIMILVVSPFQDKKGGIVFKQTLVLSGPDHATASSHDIINTTEPTR